MPRLFLLLLLPLSLFGETTGYLTFSKGSPPSYFLHIVSDQGEQSPKVKGGSFISPLFSEQIGTSPYVITTYSLNHLSLDKRHTIKTKSQTFAFLLPGNQPSLRVLIAGDLVRGNTPRFEKICQTAASFSPDLALFGGDLAYSLDKESKWLKMIFGLTTFFKKQDGDLIPIATACGNHDVHKGKNSLFFTFFPQMRLSTYFTFSFPGLLGVTVLDSGHFAPIEKKQKAFVEQALAEQQAIRNKIALYHVPAYPGVTSFQSPLSKKVRSHWCPLFSKFGVLACFEHHGHGYKRSKKIDGVTYLGDGGFGVSARKVKDPESTPYLKKTASLRHFFILDTFPDKMELSAIDSYGGVFDKKSI